MEIRIYQINPDRDDDGLCFKGMSALRKIHPDFGQIDSSIYDQVYVTEVDQLDLEELFCKFNEDRPSDYKARSMSVSDVIVAVDSEGKTNAYFCDSFGFAKVDFDESQAKIKAAKMQVVYLEPGKMAEIREIGTSLPELQEAVGGWIEAVYPFEEEVCLVCNEEGKLNGMPLNRALYTEPEQEDLTYTELRNRFYQAEKEGKHITGFIVFSQDSFTQPYSERSRTYEVSSNNKAFQAGMGGYSIYGSCLDGTDPCVRLEAYMANERGGKDGWKIERCYMQDDSRQMIDIIAGPCFICDCSGEDFGSLSQEQLDRYREKFLFPEHFIRLNGEITAIPFRPEKNQER